MTDLVKEYCRKQGYSHLVIEGGLEYLVAGWERTAADVAIGYCLEFEDYLNDLDGRRILEEVLKVASEEQRQFAEARTRSADTLFLARTIPSLQCVWGEHTEAKYGYSKEKDWWYYQIPKEWTAKGI